MKKYRLNKVKFAWFIATVISLAFIGWVAVSYVDVVAHNLAGGHNYPAWNAFEIFIKLFS